MLPSILGNVANHSGECPQIFWGMSSNIPGNVTKFSGNIFKYSGERPQHSEKCPRIFRGLSPNIPENVGKHSRKCCQTSRSMSLNNPENIGKHSGVCCKTSYERIPINVHNSAGYCWSWTLPICWKIVAVKFYFQAAGLYVAPVNRNFGSKPKERNREKKSKAKFLNNKTRNFWNISCDNLNNLFLLKLYMIFFIFLLWHRIHTSFKQIHHF